MTVLLMLGAKNELAREKSFVIPIFVYLYRTLGVSIRD
ncbi:hypothetical protein GGD38_004079 [Chitinophagaceae bacterium OAS944]|nr:hypothetical protein [Chitinophagaceae bacterium OAS944]